MIETFQAVDPAAALAGVGPEGTNLLTLAESGAVLRRGTTFVRGEVRAGRLTTVRIGRTPYIERAELARYIAAHRETGERSARPGMTPRKKAG